MSSTLDEHRHYLADRARIAAYSRAIAEVVRPGDIVVDLGAGMGILGLLACQAGAARIYAIEQTSVIEIAREVARDNGVANRFNFIKGLSTEIDLPEKADVVLADQIGYFGFGAGLLESFEDAKQRFLKPDGVLLPMQIDLCLAPIEAPELREQIEFWNRPPIEFNFQSVAGIASNTSFPVQFELYHLLAEPVIVASLSTASTLKTTLRIEATMVAERAGILHGIGGWFAAQLSPQIRMSNAPSALHPIERSGLFFPIKHPVRVFAGDLIGLQMQIFPGGNFMTWRATGWGSSGQRAPQTNWNGMILAREDLKISRPDVRPQLSSRGEAQLTVLKLCNGQRSRQEIEQSVHTLHSHLFRDQSEISIFVNEVLSRYSL